MVPDWKIVSDDAWLPPGSQWKAKLLAVPRLDPYIVWAAATQFVDLGGPPAGYLPIVIEAKAGVSARDIAQIAQGKNWIWMSALYGNPPTALKDTRYCTAFVTAAFLDHLNVELSGKIERFTLSMPVIAGEPLRTDVIATPGQPQLAIAPYDPTLGKVVVGVCDDGIAFGHQRFYTDATGQISRVRCFWNQDDPVNSAPGLGYGREILQVEMKQLMQDARHDGAIDEDALYREAGATALARYWAHGTATMDLAAGADPLPPAALLGLPPIPFPAPVPALIAVQFRQPGRTVRDTSGLWLDGQALDAFRYIIARAQAIAGTDCQTFINMSYGYFAGPHDGSSMLERAMDELSATQTCSIVLPAGNSNLDRCHGKLTIAPQTTQSLRWRVMPECLTPSFVEIWLTADNGAPQVEVAIVPPGGASSTQIGQGNVGTWTLDGERLCTVVHRGPGARGDMPMILVALAPTMTRDPARRTAPNGNWMIEVTNAGPGNVTVQTWVQRNETPAGFPARGRQSRFDDDAYVRFDRFTELQDYDDPLPAPQSWIRREGTLSSIATGSRSCVVGGYRGADMSTAPYSSTGFDQTGTPPYRGGPDVAAVSDRSIVRKGLLAAGTRSNSTVAFEGTSAAAPLVLHMSAVPVGPAHPHAPPGTTIRDAVRALAKAQTFPGGKTTDGRPLDPSEQGRRNTDDNVGAGNFPPAPPVLGDE